MDTLTIDQLLQDSKQFYGTYPRDFIPYSISNNSGIIVNTDPSDKPGEHWIAIFKDQNGFLEYFDPFGLPPFHIDILNFLNRNSKVGIGYNAQQLQCLECISCGLYCVLYMKYRCRNFTMCDFINLFQKNPYINEKKIQKLFAVVFGNT